MRHRGLQGVAAYHEKAAHGVFEVHLQKQPGQLGRQVARLQPLRGPIAGAAAGHEAAADHQIQAVLAQGRQHVRQQGFVMLQVGVDHRDVGGGACQHAFQTGRGKTAPAHAFQDAHAAVGSGDPADHLGRAVGRLVVDDHDLPGDPGKGLAQPGDQARDIVRFVVRRDHDAQIERSFGGGGLDGLLQHGVVPESRAWLPT